MQIRPLGLRRAVAIATAGAATIALGASASAANAASLDAHYVCDYPLISKNGLQVHIEATIPDTATVGELTPAFDIVATTTTEGNTYTGISLTGTKSIDGTATSATNVSMPDGSTLPLNVPVTIDHYDVPAGPPLTLTARGTAPQIMFNSPGTAKINVADIDLHLLLKKSDGSTVGAALGNGPGSVDDGDPNTNDVKCVADAGQDLTLATITVKEATPTDTPPTVPGKPIVTNVSQTGADVSWAASTDDKGADHYEVYVNGTKAKDVQGTSTTLGGLTANTTYSVTVKAVDTAGQSSDPSEATSFTTNEAPPADTPPTVPGKPSVANIAPTTADVSWTASTDDKGVDHYEVYLGGNKVADASGTSTSLTGLTANTTYSVTVKAVDTAGQSSDPSPATSFTTKASTGGGNVNVTFGLDGWTYIKGGNGWAGLSGTIAASMNLQTGDFTADLDLDPTQAQLAIFGFLPVTADITFVPVGQTTGSLDLETRVLRSQSKMDMKIPAMKVLGFLPIAGGDTCQTRYPANIALKSGRGFDPLGGGSVSGKYTMPPLADCGPLTWLINAMTARPGNTINLDLAPQLG